MGAKPIPVWIGTAGYSWPDWVGPFYPPGTTPERMPGFYATQFPFVEINSTFYRAPTKGQLSRLAIRTPGSFRFSLKVPRTISHELKGAGIEPFREAAEELTRRDRLIGLILQFPESFASTSANRDWLDTVSEGLKPHKIWVEFRNWTWRRLRLGAWLRDRGLDLAAVDLPSLPNLFPRGVISPTTTSLYVRLHSRVTDNWNGTGKVRYDYDYADDVLREWIDKIQEASEQLTNAYLVFNNCQGIQGVRNARRMAELIEKYAPELEVVGPAAPARPKQLTLFGE